MWHDPCQSVRARLPLLAGGDLLGPSRRHVERHLVTCSDCRQQLASLEKALAALHHAREQSPVPVQEASIWPGLARQIQESRRVETSWPHVLTWSSGVAASLLIVVGILALGRPFGGPVKPPVAASGPDLGSAKPAVAQAPSDSLPVQDGTSESVSTARRDEDTGRNGTLPAFDNSQIGR
jgi:hypothetical protein